MEWARSRVKHRARSLTDVAETFETAVSSEGSLALRLYERLRNGEASALQLAVSTVASGVLLQGPAAQPERSHRASSSNPIFELEAEPPSSCAYSSHKNITHSIRATTPSTLQSIPCRNGGAGRTDRKVYADSQEAANSPKPPIKKRHGSRHNPCSTETFTPTGHNFRLH